MLTLLNMHYFLVSMLVLPHRAHHGFYMEEAWQGLKLPFP